LLGYNTFRKTVNLPAQRVEYLSDRVFLNGGLTPKSLPKEAIHPHSKNGIFWLDFVNHPRSEGFK